MHKTCPAQGLELSPKHMAQKLHSTGRQPFAQALTAWRRRSGLSIAQCAQAAGITYPAWHAYEQGMAYPRVEVMQRVANALPIDWHEIISASA